MIPGCIRHAWLSLFVDVNKIVAEWTFSFCRQNVGALR